MRRKLIVYLLSMIVVVLVVTFQNNSNYCFGNNKHPLDIKIINEKLFLSFNGQKTCISLKNELNAAGGYNCKLLFQAYKNNYYYLLIDGNGMTVWPTNGNGQGGAGVEFNLVWLKLDPNLEVKSKQSILYCSYFGTDLDEKIIDKDQVTITVLKYHEDGGVIKTFLYDNDNPERGIVLIKSDPLK